jgi:hypothetical protein
MQFRRLSRREAEKQLRFCLEDGQVVRSKHFIDELAIEKMSFADALAVLRTGSVFDEPEPDLRTGDWKYRIEGREPGGKYAAVVFTFKTEDRTLLITIFSIESRRVR